VISRLSFPPLSPSKDPADYAVFQGSISRWGWRIYTQRLTHAGRWFVLITGAFSAYGGASLMIQGYVLAAYASAIWWIALVAAWLYRPKVRLTTAFSDRVCAGELLPVDVEIEQLGRLRGADLIVLPHNLPPSIDPTPEFGTPLPDLAAGQRARVRVHLRCNRRGSYTLNGFRAETSFPFGILRARRTFPDDRRLLVYPKFAPLSHLTLPTGRRYQPGGVALASQLGESFEYLGNREYREGDAVKDIDWRATARVGRPIVREWVEEYMLRVAVVLDTHVPQDLPRKQLAARRDAFERAVSLAASVSDYMARQDYLVDLFAAGPNLYHLTAGRSLAYLDQILDILACVDENPAEPFATIEPQIAELLSRISTVICVFMDFDDARRAFVQRLTQQGVGVKVIIARDGDPTLDPSAEADTLGPVAVVSKSDFDRGVDDL
jgi:uncharacterized protein (DUF58 family)